MESCAFCNVSKNSLIVGEDDLNSAFLDRNPLSKGHTLVIPKRHVEKLDELSKEELKSFFVFLSRVQRAVLKFSGSGYDIVNHYRPFLEESEMVKKHLHFHIIPRNLNDDIHSAKIGKRLELSEGEMKNIAEEISKNLKV